MKTTPSFRYMLITRLKGKSFLYEYYFKNKKTVDIGCGKGEFMTNDKSLIYGIDANPDSIRELKNKGFKVEIGNVESLPFNDEEFDMAHCHNVIEHLDIPVAHKMIQEAARVLKKGGLFVLSSEVVTKKFWETFGHVKPYPPGAIKKLLRRESRESFDSINNLECLGEFYLGDYHPNKFLYFASAFIAYYTPLFRREYFLVLKKI